MDFEYTLYLFILFFGGKSICVLNIPSSDHWRCSPHRLLTAEVLVICVKGNISAYKDNLIVLENSINLDLE